MSLSGIRGHKRSAHRIKRKRCPGKGLQNGKEEKCPSSHGVNPGVCPPAPIRAQTPLLAHTGPACQACKGWSYSHFGFQCRWQIPLFSQGMLLNHFVPRSEWVGLFSHPVLQGETWHLYESLCSAYRHLVGRLILKYSAIQSTDEVLMQWLESRW